MASTGAIRRFLSLALALVALGASLAGAETDPRSERHRKILSRSEAIPEGDSPDGRCRVCHGQLLVAPRAESPAGLASDDAMAAYQRLTTYAGGQENFHWRHRDSPYARQMMRIQCQDCHPGRDPRQPALARDDPRHPRMLRKQVDPVLCVNCHGRFPDHRTAFAGNWMQARAAFAGNCLVCHAADAGRRHASTLLAGAEIERQGAASGDVCYGCHGGRAWYAVSANAIRGRPGDLHVDAQAAAHTRRIPVTVR